MIEAEGLESEIETPQSESETPESESEAAGQPPAGIVVEARAMRVRDRHLSVGSQKDRTASPTTR